MRNGVSAYVISALITLQLFPTPSLGGGAATFLEANRAEVAPDSMEMLRSIARELLCTTAVLLHAIWRVPTPPPCYSLERYSFSGRLEGKASAIVWNAPGRRVSPRMEPLHYARSRRH